MTVRFRVNGDPVLVSGVDHHVTVLQWLRASGRTGTKEGCSEGECGACAIAVLRRDIRGRARFESINSCLVPLPALDGHSIVTVEGIADPSGELHPVQKAMVERGGSQCGYCTPGFVVSLFCEYHRPGRSGYDPEAIGGNLCRCTGYRPIVDVARGLPQPTANERWLLRLPLLQGAAPNSTAFEPAILPATTAATASAPAAFQPTTSAPAAFESAASAPAAFESAASAPAAFESAASAPAAFESAASAPAAFQSAASAPASSALQPTASAPTSSALQPTASAPTSSAPTTSEHDSDTSRFARPTDLAGVWRYLAAWPEAVLISGGTDLMVYANQRYTRFPALLSLESVRELLQFERSERELAIGAALPLSELEDRLREDHRGCAPLLEQLLPLFSSRLVRNRATLGGNLATASPIGDSLPVLLALDADVKVARGNGERRLALSEFFSGYRKTALAPGEVIVSVHVPFPVAKTQRFYKVSKRVLDDISSVSAAFALDLDADGRVARLRIAYGGVAATPVRAHSAEREAIAQPWSSETLSRVSRELAAVGTPMGDHRASAAYRRAMMVKLLEKFYASTANECGRVA